MSAVFLELFNRAVSAGWMILALLILRPVLQKIAAWVRCLLWGLAAVRLVLPIRFESAWSLVPSAETLSQNTVRYDAVPQLTSGIAALNSAVNERLMAPYFRADAAVSMNPLHFWTEIAGFVWAAGCAALLLYALVRLVQTKRRVREAALLRENIWLCDTVASPFILGVLRPRVYLPSGLDGAARDYVLAHERAHLARRDHWWKPLGYLLLAVYWFQPLCWFGYRCFCRDLELACDERAVRELGLAERKAYSSALLSCATAGRAVLACPLAFGEVGVKERVRRVLNYKKPAFWVTLIAILLCALLAVCFLTNPKTSQEAATTGDLPPMLTFGEARYVAPEKPVTHLPYGYIRAGLVTKEQSGDTNLQGHDYFIHEGDDPDMPEDLYVWQECGTAVAVNLVDSTQRQWAYVRWIRTGEDNADHFTAKLLTLDDVVFLAEKGDSLTWGDFENYDSQEVGSGLYIRQYPIDELFSLGLSGQWDPASDDVPDRIVLSARDGTGEVVDLRDGAEAVEAFIAAHEKNPVERPYSYLDLTGSDYNLTAPVGSGDLALTASVLSTNTTRIRVEATEDLEQGAELYVYLYNAEDMEDAIQYGLITEENRSVLFENLTSARVYRVGIGVKESSAQVSVDISDDSGPDRSLGLNQK